MSNTAAPTTGASSSPASVHVSRFIFPPIVHVVWGIIQLGFFVFGSMVQVQTNESFMLHGLSGSKLDWVPNFNIFLQFPQFWNGKMSPHMTVAFLAAWCIQIVMLTTKIGLARVQLQVISKYGAGASHADLLKSAKRRGRLWDILSWLIVIGNSVTDFIYAAGMGFVQQLVFTVVIFLTTFYSGTHGIQNIAAGVSDMAKDH
jgi:hypothetical protein